MYNTPGNKFAKLFCGRLDYKKYILKYTNAGHNFWLLFKDNEVIKLSKGGVPIGIFDCFEYSEDDIIFESGHTLIIYSDGVTEALNDEGKEFGKDELIKIIKRNRDSASFQIIEKIDEAIINHTNGLAQYDDLTIAVVKKR